MKKQKSSSIKNFSTRVKKDLVYLIEKPTTVFFLIVIFCIFITFFYFLVMQNVLRQEKKTAELDYGQYGSVIDRWNENEKIKQEKDKDFPLIFYRNEAKKNEIEGDGMDKADNRINDYEERIDAKKVEDLLAETLFEFFQQKEGEMPEIKERAQVWEELGLGVAQEYRGLYEQNIIFLRTLREAIDD